MDPLGLTAFVFARGGSKGVPRKNVRLAGGKPLIAIATECALASRHVSRVVVSTDCEEIAAAGRAAGAQTPFMRPDHLAGDAAAEILAWRHALDQTPEVEVANKPVFLSVPATSPLRSPEDIDAAVIEFCKGGRDVVFGITPSHRNPYLNMVTINQDGLLDIVVAKPEDTGGPHRRQDAPPVYDVTTCIYAADPTYIRRTDRLLDGRTGFVAIPPERSLDIDTEFDLHLADLLLRYPHGANQMAAGPGKKRESDG